MKEKKVISIEERLPTLRKRRKKKANRQLIFYLTIFFLLICLIIYLQSPLSHIKTIQVSGNLYMTEDELIKEINISEQTNYWKVKPKELEQKLLKNEMVKDVQVEKKFPREIRVSLTEYTKIGYFSKDSQYAIVLENGTILPGTKELEGDAPLMTGFDDEEQLIRLTNELADLSPSILNLISEIHWDPTEENMDTIYLYMTDGYLVKASIRNFSKKMQFYPSIVMQLSDDRKGVIHIGVGAYFEEINNVPEEIKKVNETD